MLMRQALRKPEAYQWICRGFMQSLPRKRSVQIESKIGDVPSIDPFKVFPAQNWQGSLGLHGTEVAAIAEGGNGV